MPGSAAFGFGVVSMATNVTTVAIVAPAARGDAARTMRGLLARLDALAYVDDARQFCSVRVSGSAALPELSMTAQARTPDTNA